MKQTDTTTAAENSRKHPASASNAPSQITAPETQTPPASPEKPVKSLYALYMEKLHAEAVARIDYSYETREDQHRAYSHAEMLDFMRRTGTAPERMADLIMTVAPDFYKACCFELVALDVLHKLFPERRRES